MGLNPFGLQADCVASYLCNLRIVNLKGLRPELYLGRTKSEVIHSIVKFYK